MLLDTTLPAEGYGYTDSGYTLEDWGQIFIQFPEANYPETLGLSEKFEVYAPFPNKLSYVVRPVGPPAPRTKGVEVTGRTVMIDIEHWPVQNPLTVTIRGVINPQKS